MKKSFFITLLFSPILLIADDLIVDKNSLNQSDHKEAGISQIKQDP